MTVSTERELWNEAERIITNGRHVKGKSKTAIEAMNRLLREKLSTAVSDSISQDSPICKELWSYERLKLLGHEQTEKKPHSDVGPLIVVNVEGHNYLIDGRRRLRRDLEQRRSRDVIVITVPAKTHSGTNLGNNKYGGSSALY